MVMLIWEQFRSNQASLTLQADRLIADEIRMLVNSLVLQKAVDISLLSYNQSDSSRLVFHDMRWWNLVIQDGASASTSTSFSSSHLPHSRQKFPPLPSHPPLSTFLPPPFPLFLSFKSLPSLLWPRISLTRTSSSSISTCSPPIDFFLLFLSKYYHWDCWLRRSKKTFKSLELQTFQLSCTEQANLWGESSTCR